MKHFLIFLVKIYKKIFPGLQAVLHGNVRVCRFYPNCSDYAIESLQKTSTTRACFLIVKRIFKCHPFQKGGYDPV